MKTRNIAPILGGIERYENEAYCRWRWPFRCRGSRRESAVARLFSLALLRFMKIHTISTILAVAILLAGCGKKGASSIITPPKDQTSATLEVTPVAQASITAWQKGDTTGAVSNFLAADWSARPLFASDSTLSLTEDQVRSFSDADSKTKAKDLGLQLDLLKKLAAAVAQAGTNSAAHGDFAQARKYFVSLGQFGTAMNDPGHVKLVQLWGLVIKRRADTELAKIGQ